MAYPYPHTFDVLVNYFLEQNEITLHDLELLIDKLDEFIRLAPIPDQLIGYQACWDILLAKHRELTVQSVTHIVSPGIA